MHLLYDLALPGFTYLYSILMESVRTKNIVVNLLILRLLVGYIFANVACVLFVWLPYIQKKKAAVSLLSRAIP